MYDRKKWRSKVGFPTCVSVKKCSPDQKTGLLLPRSIYRWGGGGTSQLPDAQTRSTTLPEAGQWIEFWIPAKYFRFWKCLQWFPLTVPRDFHSSTGWWNEARGKSNVIYVRSWKTGRNWTHSPWRYICLSNEPIGADVQCWRGRAPKNAGKRSFRISPGGNGKAFIWKSNVWRNGFSRHFPGKNDWGKTRPRTPGESPYSVIWKAKNTSDFFVTAANCINRRLIPAFTPSSGRFRRFRIAFPWKPILQRRSIWFMIQKFWFAIRIFHAILLLLTEYDALLHHIDCQFINMEKSVTCFLLKNRTIYSRTWQFHGCSLFFLLKYKLHPEPSSFNFFFSYGMAVINMYKYNTEIWKKQYRVLEYFGDVNFIVIAVLILIKRKQRLIRMENFLLQEYDKILVSL